MKPEMIKKYKVNNKHRIMEKKWNERFILEKIPQYDAYKDINYLSLGLVKSKIRYEEKQLKECQKKTKKLRTNSSRHTLNTKPKKNMYSPLFNLIKENEKTDLFSLKLAKRPLTIKRSKMKLNKTIDINLLLKKNKDKQEKEKHLKTEENQHLYNQIQTNNNDDNDKECIVIDKALADQLNEIKDLWDRLGVTPEYQIFFGEMLDKLKKREIVEKYLSYEKRQLTEFKSDLEKLMNDIYKRENDLSNLKKIEEIYAKNEQLNKYNILKNKKLQNSSNKKAKNKNNKSIGQSEDEINQYKARNKNGNKYDEDNVEKSKEFDEEFTKYKVNKEKIENDIGNCLKLLRLHTINTVSQFTKFRINYNFYFTSGKNDVNQMKNGYEFDYNYLLKIKKDCEFFKKSSFRNIFNFREDCENDPFFLNLLNNNNDNDNNNNSVFKYLTATEDTISSIHECMFILDQEEMYFKISQNQNQNNTNENNETKDNNESNTDKENENEKNNSKAKNKKIPIGVNYQGNLGKEISKLKAKNEYKNLFFNSRESKELIINNNNMDENINNKCQAGPKRIPETSSKELFQSFKYYDKIKNNIYNQEEIQDMKNNCYKNSNNKIVIYSKDNNNSNENKDKFSNKANSLNLNFNNICKKNKNQSGNNPLKINLNCINIRNNEKMKKRNNKNIKLNNLNNNNMNNNKLEENKTQENNINNTNSNMITTENEKNSNYDNNNYDKNNITDEGDKDIDNNIVDETNIVEENISIDEKYINCKYISIISLVNKQNYTKLKISNNNSFILGNYMFKMMNPFTLDLLLNSLKYKNKFSISNCTSSIVLSSPEEIKNNCNFILNHNNSISNMSSLENILKENDLYLLESNKSSIKYAFLSSFLNLSFSSLISSSIIYNSHNYNGIKINSSKNVIFIEEDIIIYTIPTKDEDTLIYICPYNEKIEEIIKKYDKNHNIFNGFSSFVNIINLYYEENENNNDGNEMVLWLPCFEVDTQLICDKIPGYKRINIRNNTDKKDMQILEYDEIIKINFRSNLNERNNVNGNNSININQNEDIIIENDFIFGICHKEIKDRYNIPFISIAFIGKENFIIEEN